MYCSLKNFSLALSDLLVGAVVMPLALINDLSAHGWRFGQDFCKIWIASDVMCSTASILNLMAISFDRYLFQLATYLTMGTEQNFV